MSLEEINIKNFFNFDKKYLKISLYFFFVMSALIFLFKITDNLGSIVGGIYNIWSAAIHITSPFLYGFAIAYLFNPLVLTVENKLLGRISKIKNKTSLKRTLSILSTYLVIIGCIIWLMTFFIPESITNVKNLINTLPSNMNAFDYEINNFLASFNFIIDSKEFSSILNSIFEPIMNITKNLPSVTQKIIDGTFIAASTTLNLILGIFISFYMLSEKEHFMREIKKILYAFCPEKKVDKFLSNASRVNSIFKNFIVGKTIDSAIIGVLCFIGMSIIQTPYIVLISLIVGITNMIPYFGPFIGAIPSILIVLIVDPAKAIWVALFILALQQLDGIVIGPKILGVSTGMSPLWIILSIIVGGAVAGPLGMFIGVPVCASIKLFFSEIVNQKYAEKYFYEYTEKPKDTLPESQDNL